MAAADQTRRASIGVELDLAAIGRVPEPVEVAGITSSPRRSPTRPGRRTPRSCASPPRSEATASVCRSATTARGRRSGPRLGPDGLRDRAEARGGSLEVSSPPGEGTLILVLLPLRLH